MSAPEGYVTLGDARGDARVVCRADCAPAVEEAIAAGTLYAWAAAHPARRELRGRAAAYAAPLPRGAGDVVVRHSWHGGLLAPLTRDLFLPPTRAPRELDASLRLRAARVRTPEVVAYAVYPAGPFRRADVATRLVPDGRDLSAVIADRDAPTEEIAGPHGAAPLGAWVRPTGALLHALATAGVRHPDLNLKNVLLTPAADAGAESPMLHDAWVLDVDVARLPRGPVTDSLRATVAHANLARLARSLRKWRDERGLRVSELEIDALGHFGRRGADAPVALRWRPGHSPAHAS